MYMHHQFSFGLVIIMLMKSDPDAVRNNIFAYAVRNIFVDVNAVNIFLLLTLTPSIYFVARTSLLYPHKKAFAALWRR